MAGELKVPGTELCLDGVYCNPEETSSKFLRFTSGMVEGVSVSGGDRSPESAAAILDRQIDAERDEGQLTVEGSKVSFSLSNRHGTVDYEGELTAAGDLILDTHSHINGNRRSAREFKFLPVEKGPRRLTEMIPMAIKLDCTKFASGSVYEHRCGLKATDSGWPLPTDEETVLGRWAVQTARLFVDIKEDPNGGAYITEGTMGVLLTDKSLRGSFIDGKGRAGRLRVARDVLTIYWPYSRMAEPIVSHYEDDRTQHVIVEDAEEDGHLGMRGITIPKDKADNTNNFLSPVFSIKDRSEAFFEQLSQARAQFLAAGEAAG